MTDFAPHVATPTVAPLDPTKHVNYTLGMVLGVDDFTQEFAYLNGRDQWMARALLGYGTVCGLRVTVEADARGPRVNVSPGVAVNPRGQMIRVPAAECAYLNDWIQANRPHIADRLASPPTSSSLPLLVALTYRDCPTDQVPIPGEPCRTEGESTISSRLTDDFVLELRLDTPDQQPNQREEDGVRHFVAWLRQIQLSDAPGSFTTLHDFVQAVRQAMQPMGSPPGASFGSPPASSIRIHPADLPDFLRTAFRIWVTEGRPLWLGPNAHPTGDPPVEQYVLLAELHVPLIHDALTDRWKVDDRSTLDAIADDSRRPYLIDLRMLQEWLLAGLAGTSPASPPRVGGGGGPVSLGLLDRVRALGSPSPSAAQPTGPAPAIVAAGRFDARGSAAGRSLFSYNGLHVRPIGQNLYFLRFPGFRLSASYVVKGTPLINLDGDWTPQSFEAVPNDDVLLGTIVQELGDPEVQVDAGIFVRAMHFNGQPISAGFMVEISQY